MKVIRIRGPTGPTGPSPGINCFKIPSNFTGSDIPVSATGSDIPHTFEGSPCGIVPEGSGYYKSNGDTEISIISEAEIQLGSNHIVIPMYNVVPPLPDLDDRNPLCPKEPIVNITIDEVGPKDQDFGGENITNASSTKDLILDQIYWDEGLHQLSFVVNCIRSIPVVVKFHIRMCYPGMKSDSREVHYTLISEQVDWDIGKIPITATGPTGTTLGKDAFMFRLDSGPTGSNTMPGPLLEARYNDTLTINFVNALTIEPPLVTVFQSDGSPTGTFALPTKLTVHPHGIEGNNASDGTPVTQAAVNPEGGQYIHSFRMHRPGLFWYHNHFKPINPTFRGLYGPIIVTDHADDVLTDAGIIPKPFDQRSRGHRSQKCGSNIRKGVLILSTITVNEDSTIPIKSGSFGGGMSFQGPFGQTMLINGKAAAPTFEVLAGEGIRLRMFNLAIHRFFVISVTGSGDNNIYRIGGEGGILNNARLEGNGHVGTYDPGYPAGTILIATSNREEIVFLIRGRRGDTITLSAEGFKTSPGPFSGEFPPAPIAFFKIVGEARNEYSIENGTPLRNNKLVCDPNKSLADAYVGQLAEVPVGLEGTTNPTIQFGPGAKIDGIDGSGLENMLIPPIQSSRYAYCGDILELNVKNITSASHPYHLHGFSFQPIRLVDNDTQNVLFEWDYVEFRDVHDVPPDTTLYYRIRTDDRPTRDKLPGGVLGRWFHHCHIFIHAASGMIAEIIIIPRPE